YGLMLWVLRANYTDEVITSIKSDAYTIQSVLRNNQSDDYASLLNDVFRSKINDGIRITLMDKNGGVSYDSHNNHTIMANHGDREEFKAALEGQIGQAIRFSTTVRAQMVYIAIPFSDAYHDISVIRTAYPLTSIYSFSNHIVNYIIIVFGIGLILSYFWASKLSAYVLKPIRLIINSTKRISTGYNSGDIEYRSDDELGELCRYFNEMNSYNIKKGDRLMGANNNLSSILSSILNSVMVLDRNKKLVFCNKSAEQFLGKSFTEMQGRPFIELLRDYEINKFIESFFIDRKASIKEIVMNNSVLRFNLYSNEGLFNEFKEGIVLVIQDVTEIRKIERIRKDFVTNVTHELKTPLTSIKGYIELLKDRDELDDATKLRFLEIIEIEADRLTDLINDLLLLSDVENNKGRIEMFKINEIIDEVIEIMNTISSEKGIEIACFYASEATIFGDKNRFKQMMINLIDNAVKYTNPGGKVRITTVIDEAKIFISVEDNGIGIEKKHIDRLFERFYRTDKSRSRAEGGTGLGLAIVKHIVKNFDGMIKVESEVDVGSKFTVIIPLKPV
ncbi:MAG: ATP-binding protein, partial [Eubacteriales bacterium]|nr:ATP-binding protein [Eubacteriales bacterium]